MDILIESTSTACSNLTVHAPWLAEQRVILTRQIGRQTVQIDLQRPAFPIETQAKGTPAFGWIGWLPTRKQAQALGLEAPVFDQRVVTRISSTRLISSIPSEPYILLRPIPVKIKRIEDNDFLASFEEANISMSGETEQEALQNLIAHILDVFEIFSEEESSLGPEPARQLRVLKQYIKPQT